MIKHFKFLLMAISAFFFIACGNSDGSDTSASALMEGKTFYVTWTDSTDYGVDFFNDGVIENKMYNLSTNELLDVSYNSKYTFSGDKLTITNIGSDENKVYTVSSIANGIRLKRDIDATTYDLYNTLEDAKNNPRS